MGQRQETLTNSRGIHAGLLTYRLDYFAFKRVLDLTIALMGLLFLAPALIIISLLIMLDSRGPVLFIQKRVGAKRWRVGSKEHWEVTPFHVYKFRTMKHNCDQTVHKEFIEAFAKGDIPADSEMKAQVKLTDDPRITRLGKILRRTSLDELPQLINVIKGEMSLVGPRPVPEYEAAQYRPDQRARLHALPGITGLWQVKGRSQVSFDEMVRMDIEYIQNQSLWLDIKLLLLTIPVALSGRGAH